MWTTAIALSLLAAAPGQETQATDAPTADELHDAFVELQDAYDEARQEFYAEMNASWKAYQESGNTEEPWDRPEPIEPVWYPNFVELADLGSHEANVWCVQTHGASGLEGDAARTDKSMRYESILGEERDVETLSAVAYALQNEAGDGAALLGREAAFGFLGVIDEMTEEDGVRALTLYVRGNALAPYGATAEQSKEASKYYREAAQKYPGTELGKRCAGLAFAAEKLQIGQKAPNIVGKDHDGNALALADFAGKVTVIDFWGFW